MGEVDDRLEVVRSLTRAVPNVCFCGDEQEAEQESGRGEGVLLPRSDVRKR